MPDAINPQAFDRYAYSYNNPVNYIDPTGHIIGQPPLNNQQCGPDMIYCGGLADPNNEWEVMEYQYAGGEITGEEYYDWLVDNGSFAMPSEYSLFTYGGQYTKSENYQMMDFKSHGTAKLNKNYLLILDGSILISPER